MMIAKISQERGNSIIRPVVERSGASEGAALQDVRLAKYYRPCPHCRLLGSDRVLECRGCGLIFAKWRRRDAPIPAPTRPWCAARGSIKAAAGALVLAFALAAFRAPTPDARQSNYGGKVAEADFNAKVLGASTPVLLMFDVTRRCGCAEEELRELSRQWNGQVSVVTMNAVDSPALGAKFGVRSEPIVMLFKDGQLVKTANAAEMERSIMSRHGGKYDSGEMKAALEDFVQKV